MIAVVDHAKVRKLLTVRSSSEDSDETIKIFTCRIILRFLSR